MTAAQKPQAQTTTIPAEQLPGREPTLLDKIVEASAALKRDVDPLRAMLKEQAPKWFDVNRIYAGLDAAIMKEPRILQADRKSLYLALGKVARRALDLGDGIDLVIVNKNVRDGEGWKKVDMVEAWEDYKGLKALAIRNGVIRGSLEGVIYEGEEWMHKITSDGVKFEHTPNPSGGKNRKIVAAYTLIDLPYGRKTVYLMPIDEIEKVRAKSRGWNDVALEKKKEPKGCPSWYAMKTPLRGYLNKQPKARVILGDALTVGEDVPPDFDLPDYVTPDGEDLRTALPTSTDGADPA